MSLADCIRKAGKALDAKDAQAIQDLVDTGVSEDEAVAQHLATIDTEIEGIFDQVEAAGGTVARPEPTRDLDLSDLGIEVQELSDEEYQQALDLFRPERRLEIPASTRGRTIAGTAPDAAWSSETRVSTADGRPVALFRGTSIPLDASHFSVESLGKNTGFAASGLGVWMTSSAQEAAGYGPNVESFHLDIRNPKVYRVGEEDLPDFDTIDDAQAFRETLREQGHDGIVIDLREVGAGQHVVAFDPEQVIYPQPLELYQAAAAAEAERGRLGFYSAVEQAVLDMPLPEWKPKAKLQLSEEETARLGELDITSTADPNYEEWTALVEKQRKAEGLASGKQIWAKLKKTAGVKAEELQWLGVEDYLLSGDKFTRNEVAEFIRDNGVQVEETVAEAGEGEPTEIDWTSPVAWDADEAWEHDAEYYHDEAEEFGLNHEALKSLAETESDYIEKNKDPDEDVDEYLQREFSSELDDLVWDLARDRARDVYYDNPIYIQEATDIDLIIFGNDDQGYDVRTSMSYSDVVASDIWSQSEAEIQAEEYAREHDLLVSEEDVEVTKWEEYVTEGDYDNYRELKLTLPDLEADYYNDVHFPDRNIVAFLRVTDRELWLGEEDKEFPEAIVDYEINIVGAKKPDAIVRRILEITTTDGEVIKSMGLKSDADENEVLKLAKNLVTRPGNEIGENYHVNDKGQLVSKERIEKATAKNTYFIDEFQSDWHQQGRKEGYQTGRDAGELEQEVLAKEKQINTEIIKFYDELYGDDETRVGRIQDVSMTPERQREISLELSEGDRDVGVSTLKTVVSSILKKGAPPARVLGTWDELNTILNESGVIGQLRPIYDDYVRLQVELSAELSGVPDAPFKGNAWLSLGLKRALVDAVESGAEAIAWADANVLADRWSDRYINLYKTQYDTKMPSMAKKLTGIKPVHLDMDGQPIVAPPKFEPPKFDIEMDEAEGGYVIIDENGEHQREYGGEITMFSTEASASEYVERLVTAAKTRFELDYEAGLGYWTIPITEELKAKVKGEGFALFQPGEPGEPGPRAAITLLDDERIIRLGQTSDLSSFLHESAHLFLEMEKQFAAQYGVTEDQQTLLDWMEAESFDDVTIENHEKFAETFEAYLREGKAPSFKLREAFAAFRRWLTRIYQSLRQLARADLTSDITEVFDRMLASDVEIAAATANPAYDQFFRSKEQAGMTDAEWEKYQKQAQRAKSTATVDLDQKLFKELFNRRSKEWQEEKRPLIVEEKEALAKQPVYAILNDTKEYPMDYNVVKEVMGFEKPPGRLIGKLKKDGTDPAEYAEVYGFPSVPAMINAVVNAPTLKEAAEAAAEQRMVQKYGDILNDGSIEAEVREVVHNDEQAELLLQELTALKRKVGSHQQINRDYLKAEAKTIIQGMKYKEIRPDKFYRAEIRAAQKAATAENEQEIFAAKVQQIANHYLYKEAVATREDMQKHRKYARRVQTREYKAREVAPEYIQNMKTLANLYDLKTQPEQQQAIDSILNWYSTQIADENQYVEITLLDPHLVLALEARQRGEFTQLQLPAFDELTAEQLRGLYDMLRHLRYVGGKMSDAAKAEMTAKRMKLAESINEHGGKDAKKLKGVPRPGDITRKRISHMVNKIPSLRNLIRKLDGFKDEGAAFDEIFNVINDANNEKLRLHREIYDRFEVEMDGIHKVGLDRRNEVDYTLQNGETLTLHPEARFMMAVYWGTETSREAVREGFNVTDVDVTRILSDMTPEQLELVNAVWRVNESLWPALSKASVELYGVAPPKLDATPFEVNGVKLTGGHMRLMYDSTRLELKSEQEKTGKLASVMPTKAGSLHSRIGSGGRPVRLDKNNIGQSLSENVHFIAFAEAGSTLRSLVNADDVKGAIERKHGEGFYQSFLETIDSITSDRHAHESIPGLAAFFRLLRRAATFKHLAYSIRNTVQQIGALPVAMEEIGYVDYINASIRFAASPSTLSEFVREKSAFMENRASLVNREAHEYLQKTTVDTRIEHVWHQFVKYGFTPQTVADSLVAFPTWLAKYEQGIEAHGSEKKAVADADIAVAESVGAGDDLHLGGAFHSTSNEFVRTMTIFGTWFNAYYQRIYRGTKGGSDLFNRDAMMSVMITPFVVAVLSAALVMDGPADDEEWLAWAMKRWGVFMAGTVPILRDIVGAFSGFAPKTVFGGGGEAPARLLNEAQAYAEGKQTGLKATSDITKVVTTVVPVPGIGNITRMMDYMDSYNRGREGEWNSYQAIVEGPERNK